MHIPSPHFDSTFLIYVGAIGILLGFVSFLLFLYHRIRWVIGALSKKQAGSMRLLVSLRNLMLITVWISIFGMVIFFGFFLRAYHVFNIEEPVAEVFAQSLPGAPTPKTSLVGFFCAQSHKTRYLFVKGDQWMLEGDILKWKSWLNFLGFHTRYRLTRLRGRYVSSAEEVHQPQTVYSLVEYEDDPLWRYLYKYGPQLPFVSTVYGNAVFQTSGENKRYLIYVGTSGFIVREKQE